MAFRPSILAIAAVVGLTMPAWAADAPATAAGSPSETAAKPAVPSGLEGVKITGSAGNGLTISTEDGNYSMNLRARMLQAVSFTNDKTWTQDASIRRLRTFMRGNIFSPDTRYWIHMAYGPIEYNANSASPIYDAWVEHTFNRDFILHAGQDFVPFDRSRTIRELAMQFTDRAPMIKELTLDRDFGAYIFSDDWFGLNNLLSYRLGVFAGEGRNPVAGSVPGGLYVGRIAIKPFGRFDDEIEGDLNRLPKPRLMIGVAAGYDQNSSRTQATTGDPFKSGIFDYANLAADAHFKWQGLSVLAEVVGRKGFPDFRDFTNTTVTPNTTSQEYVRNGVGYLVQAGYMLTDKVEATARWSQLMPLGTQDPSMLALIAKQGNEAAFGLNYYLNGHQFKFQTGYAYRFGDGTVAPQHIINCLADMTF